MIICTTTNQRYENTVAPDGTIIIEAFRGRTVFEKEELERMGFLVTGSGEILNGTNTLGERVIATFLDDDYPDGEVFISGCDHSDYYESNVKPALAKALKQGAVTFLDPVTNDGWYLLKSKRKTITFDEKGELQEKTVKDYRISNMVKGFSVYLGEDENWKMLRRMELNTKDKDESLDVQGLGNW